MLDKFDALDDATDIEGMLSDLLDQLDLDGVDPDDLSGWLGTRAAAAVWLDPANEDFTVALAFASRDDGAAGTAWPTFSKPATKSSAMSSPMGSRSWR